MNIRSSIGYCVTLANSMSSVASLNPQIKWMELQKTQSPFLSMPSQRTLHQCAQLEWTRDQQCFSVFYAEQRNQTIIIIISHCHDAMSWMARILQRPPQVCSSVVASAFRKRAEGEPLKVPWIISFLRGLWLCHCAGQGEDRGVRRPERFLSFNGGHVLSVRCLAPEGSANVGIVLVCHGGLTTSAALPPAWRKGTWKAAPAGPPSPSGIATQSKVSVIGRALAFASRSTAATRTASPDVLENVRWFETLKNSLSSCQTCFACEFSLKTKHKTQS